MPPDQILPVVIVTVEWLGRLFFSAFLLLRRRPLTPTLAWLVAINTIPLVGIAAFLLIGDLRLSSRRQPLKRAFTEEHILPLISRWHEQGIAWEQASHRFDPVKDFAEAAGGMPALMGHRHELLDTTEGFHERLLADVKNAQHEIFLSTYIWHGCYASTLLTDALINAAARGVDVRILVDDAGRRLAGDGGDLERLRSGGVTVVRALPLSLYRMLFRRLDARNHRKLIAIDNRCAYCGSHNIVDRSFGTGGRRDVGPWIDATVRFEGPLVEGIRLILLRDLQYDASHQIADPPPPVPPMPDGGPGRAGDSALQLVASSIERGERGVLEQTFHTAIYAARKRVWITTPYFCPEESVLAAIMATARRGVEVRLIVPKRNDNRLVAAAEHSLWPELLAAGVHIHRYTPALLHTKCMLVDDELVITGSANMDIRSFEINLEATLFIYDGGLCADFERLLQSYLDDSETLTQEAARRGVFIRLRDHLALLLKQLL